MKLRVVNIPRSLMDLGFDVPSDVILVTCNIEEGIGILVAAPRYPSIMLCYSKGRCIKNDFIEESISSTVLTSYKC